MGASLQESVCPHHCPCLVPFGYPIDLEILWSIVDLGWFFLHGAPTGMGGGGIQGAAASGKVTPCRHPLGITYLGGKAYC